MVAQSSRLHTNGSDEEIRQATAELHKEKSTCMTVLATETVARRIYESRYSRL